MSLLVPARKPARELLDDVDLPSDEMARSLRDLDLVNASWGGGGALLDHLVRGMRAAPRPVSGGVGDGRFVVLDIGAGSGGVSRSIARRLDRERLRAAVVPVDLQWRHLAAGRSTNDARLAALCADAFTLPFADRSADWIVSTLVFHHFSPEQNRRMLAEVARVARRGFAMLDLRRHLFPWIFVSLAGRLVFETPVSLHDGKASVLQAYTPDEAREIAVAAVPGAKVERVFPYRILITGPGS